MFRTNKESYQTFETPTRKKKRRDVKFHEEVTKKQKQEACDDNSLRTTFK